MKWVNCAGFGDSAGIVRDENYGSRGLASSRRILRGSPGGDSMSAQDSDFKRRLETLQADAFKFVGEMGEIGAASLAAGSRAGDLRDSRDSTL